MSVSGVSGAGNFQIFQSLSQQSERRADIQQLGQALQSGDVTSAQAAVTLLSPSTPASATSPVGTATPATGGTFTQALAQIGSDLQSGDLAGAQQAFSSWQSSVQSSGGQGQDIGWHHHHHAASADGSISSASSPFGRCNGDGDGASGTSATNPFLGILTAIENTLTQITTELDSESTGTTTTTAAITGAGSTSTGGSNTDTTTADNAGTTATMPADTVTTVAAVPAPADTSGTGNGTTGTASDTPTTAPVTASATATSGASATTPFGNHPLFTMLSNIENTLLQIESELAAGNGSATQGVNISA